MPSFELAFHLSQLNLIKPYGNELSYFQLSKEIDAWMDLIDQLQLLPNYSEKDMIVNLPSIGIRYPRYRVSTSLRLLYLMYIF